MASPTTLLLVLLASMARDSLQGEAVTNRTYFRIEKDAQFSGMTDEPLCSSSPCTGSLLFCGTLCASDSSCHSFSYNTSTRTCWKNSGSIYTWGAELNPSSGIDYVGRTMDDITEGVWVLAFRGQAHNGDGNIRNLWTSTGVHSDGDMANLDFDTVSKVGVPGSAHYRSRWLDQWSNIKRVKLAMYKGGVQVVTMIFDGDATDNENWFSHDKLLSSTYTDLVDASGIQKFSIQGVMFRQFYVSMESNYFQCSSGTESSHWLMVQAAKDNTCSWSSMGDIPEFYFSTNNTVSDYSTGEWDTADVMAVFVKFTV